MKSQVVPMLVLAFGLCATKPLLAAKPAVWVISDMTDSRLPGPGTSGTITDPDDISAMAAFLLFANEFDVRGLTIASTSRKEIANAPDQAKWANEYLGGAYRSDVTNLNANLGGYPEQITFRQSSIKGFRFSDTEDYSSLHAYPSVEALLQELSARTAVLYVLCWGPVSEPAILVKHCQSTGKHVLLSRMRIVAHWTNSYLHNTGDTDSVANCNFDKAACAFLKRQAREGIVKYFECGASGQSGIVGGAPAGKEYFDQFKTSRLGTVFVNGKFQHGKVDWSDGATYMALLGTHGVSLTDLTADGQSSSLVEQKIEEAFRANSRKIHDELLRRSKAAATAPKTPGLQAHQIGIHWPRCR